MSRGLGGAAGLVESAAQARAGETSADTSRSRLDGDVTIEMTCTVALGDVAFTGLPGQRTVSERAVEVTDVYRGGGVP